MTRINQETVFRGTVNKAAVPVSTSDTSRQQPSNRTTSNSRLSVELERYNLLARPVLQYPSPELAGTQNKKVHTVVLQPRPGSYATFTDPGMAVGYGVENENKTLISRMTGKQKGWSENFVYAFSPNREIFVGVQTVEFGAGTENGITPHADIYLKSGNGKYHFLSGPLLRQQEYGHTYPQKIEFKSNGVLITCKQADWMWGRPSVEENTIKTIEHFLEFKVPHRSDPAPTGA